MIEKWNQDQHRDVNDPWFEVKPLVTKIGNGRTTETMLFPTSYSMSYALKIGNALVQRFSGHRLQYGSKQCYCADGSVGRGRHAVLFSRTWNGHLGEGTQSAGSSSANSNSALIPFLGWNGMERRLIEKSPIATTYNCSTIVQIMRTSTPSTRCFGLGQTGKKGKLRFISLHFIRSKTFRPRENRAVSLRRGCKCTLLLDTNRNVSEKLCCSSKREHSLYIAFRARTTPSRITQIDTATPTPQPC